MYNVLVSNKWYVKQMAYVDATVCDGFNVPRVRPPIKFWTIELLRERELQEIANGGIGMGELHGPYIEEDIDTMPDDEEVKRKQ